VGARDLPEIIAFNKADLADDDRRLVLRGLAPDAVFVSARTGEGIDELTARIAELLPAPELEVTLLVPYDRGEIISRLHVSGRVLATDYREDGTLVTALVHPARLAEVQEFVTA
jgi:GTP-binding protein HflX